MKLYYDNQTPINKVGGLEDGTITLRRKDEHGNPVYNYSSTLIFIKEDADYIRNLLITDPNAVVNIIEVKLIDECCNKEFLFNITTKGIEWCQDRCEIRVNLVEYSPETKLYDLAASTLIYDDWNGFVSQADTKWKHPRLAYCIEMRPEALQEVLFIFAYIFFIVFTIILIPIAIILMAFLKIINAIIDVLQTLGSNMDNIGGSFNDPKDYINFVENAAALVVGCNRCHPSPLVHSYIINVCTKIGCTFSSSILYDATSDYFRTLLLNAPQEKGTLLTSGYHILTGNLPEWTLSEFLDELKQIFNADWRIVGNTLYFENKDWFKNNQKVIFDATSNPEKVISECYRWNEEEKYAFAHFHYSDDAIDNISNENRYKYDKIIDWNVPYSPTQKGKLDVMFPFGRAKFRNEGTKDIIQGFEDLPLWKSVAKTSEKFMFLNNGKTAVPKLIIWDGADVNTSLAKRGFGTTTPPPTNVIYGDPNAGMWFEGNYPGTDYMYQRFWKNENPRNQFKKYLTCTLIVKYDCEILADVDINGSVIVNKGQGQIEDISIDFKSKTITYTLTL